MDIITGLKEDKVLMKNNMLVKARYNLSLVENRIFLFMLYRLQRENKGILKCNISHKEFKDIIKYKDHNTVKGILEVLEELRRKPIFFKEEKKNKKGSLWGAYGFINGYVYDDELGTFEIEASEKIHDILKEYLKMGYTPVNVQIWLSLNNSYSQRFYDLLRLWSGSKTVVNYKLEEIKELLMLEEKYDRYNDFKRRVLIPGITGLNNTGYFYIEFKENKIGKKIDSIDFIVKDLDKRIYFDKNINMVSTHYPENIKDGKEDDIKKDFYVPNRKLFTNKTLSDFIKDFSSYDFSISEYKRILQDSILITLEKDNSDKVKAKSYNYFKTVLNNKLSESTSKPSKIKTKQHNVNSTFDKYKEDELEKVLAESQRDKFNDDRIFVPSFPNPNK